MKLKFLSFCLFIISGFGTQNLFSQSITSFSPTSGPTGTLVTIDGTGFSPVAPNNIVMFDNVRATVTNSSSTQLDVLVPYGSSSYAEISVTTGGLRLSSSRIQNAMKYFNVTFPNGVIAANAYSTSSQAVVGTPICVASGDMNNDGKSDIITLVDNSTTDSVKIYLGNGSGGFSRFSAVMTGALTSGAIAIADLENDGDLDVVISTYNSSSDIKFFTNDGSGVLTGSYITSAGYILSLKPADINNDGYVDFIASSGSWYLNKLINNQNNTFTSSQITAASAEACEVGDFNNDGNIDVLAARNSSSQVECLLGNGSGTFTSAGNIPAAMTPTKLAKGDFNKDSILDFAVSSYTNNVVGYSLGNGDGTFNTISTYPALNARDVRVADLDGNGVLDLESMIYTGGTPGFYVLKGNPNATFNNPITVPGAASTVQHHSATISDFNNDGKVDIVTGSSSAGAFKIHIYNPPLAVTIPVFNNVSCNSGNNGKAKAFPTGGTSPYSYSWSNGGVVDSIINLVPGTYTVTVTDAILATATATVTITEPSIITTSAGGSDPLCFNGTDGTAVNFPTGGTPPYSYLWSPSGQTTQTATGLGAGTYNVTITDANGCTAFDLSILNNPPDIVLIMGATNPQCFGTSTGAAFLNSVTGGAGGYTYNWAFGGQTNDTITGLFAGTYSVTVTDANGCTKTDFSGVYDPPQLLMNAYQITNAGCAGDTLGSAYALATGGIPPYFYSWNTGTINDTIINLASGTYTATVVDNYGCTMNSNVFIGFNSAATDMFGRVKLSSPVQPIDDGTLYVFKHQPGSSILDSVGSVIINFAGEYYMNMVPAGDYLLKAVPNPVTFPTSVDTYYGDHFQWDSAQVFHHGCLQTDTADINVIVQIGNGGSGIISGTITQGPGFGNRMMVPGDPIPGVGVNLGRKPGGQSQMRTTTNAAGQFTFTGVPIGDYWIFADIPNLPMDSTREVSITPVDTVSLNNNYKVDSTQIYIENLIGVLELSQTQANSVVVFPNPVNDVFSVKFDLMKNERVTLEIYNSVGQVVFSKQESAVIGKNTISLTDATQYLSTGSYQIKISSSTKTLNQKFIITKN